MSRRTKYEIWVDILESCLNESKTQSYLVRMLRLKTDHAKESIDFLMTRNLLQMKNEGKNDWIEYFTTTKGKKALYLYYKLIMIFPYSEFFQYAGISTLKVFEK